MVTQDKNIKDFKDFLLIFFFNGKPDDNFNSVTIENIDYFLKPYIKNKDGFSKELKQSLKWIKSNEISSNQMAQKLNKKFHSLYEISIKQKSLVVEPIKKNKENKPKQSTTTAKKTSTTAKNSTTTAKKSTTKNSLCNKQITFSKEEILDYSATINSLLGVGDKYCILDNKGGGDCFFLAMEKAVQNDPKFKSSRNDILSKPSIKKFRTLVADNFNFNLYRELKQVYEPLKQSLNNPSLTQDQQEFVRDTINDMGLLLDKNDLLVSQDKYKKFIKTKNYWANAQTIALIEQLLPLKFIIFSNDSDAGEFYVSATPTTKSIRTLKYIMLIKNDSHFSLLIVKDPQQFIFDYDNLPKEVKSNTNFANYIRLSENL